MCSYLWNYFVYNNVSLKEEETNLNGTPSPIYHTHF